MAEDTLHTWRREQLVLEVRTQRARIVAHRLDESGAPPEV